MIRILSFSLAFASVTFGADWRQFRGNRVDGIGEAADTYPATGFAKAWTVDLPGRGLSSPIIVEGNVIVTAASGPEQKRLHVLCFDEKSGTLKWERQFWATGRTMCHEKTCVAAPSPASDGKRIFALYSSNDLVCLDLEGNLQWLRGLTVDYPNASNSLGLATSPVFVGNTLVVQIENDSESFAAGIDPYTGENQWKIDRTKKANWCSPVLIGDHTVVLQGSAGLDGIDPATGKALWSFKSGASTIPSSAVGADGIVYTPSNGLTALKPNATDSPEQVWQVGKLRPGTASPILIGDRIFTINTANVIDCAEVKTGKELWSTRLEGPISGSPVAAGNRIYVFAERKGLGQIVDVSGEGEAKITGTIELEDTILCTPALANGAVYVRSDGHLWKLVDLQIQ
jgi:outer membrane protein assembly factor BamB